MPTHSRTIGAALLLATGAAACRSAARSSTAAAPVPTSATSASTSAAPSGGSMAGMPGMSAPAAAQGEAAAIARARADSARLPYTAADIRFMSDMIHHHSQAIVMSRMAPTHGASPAVQRLASRIINAQLDEIASMQTWLRDRNLPAPAVDTVPGAMGGMAMGGMSHDMGHDMGHDMSHPMLMPGMLTPEQMRQLDHARGKDFDRLFLSDMIQHHSGATSMVRQLFATPGAAQDETVFKFASDVNVDQTTEIARMQKMLATVLFDGDGQ